MASLFDDHPRPRPHPVDVGRLGPSRPSRPRRQFPPLLAGVLAILAVAIGAVIGHEAWRSSGLVSAPGQTDGGGLFAGPGSAPGRGGASGSSSGATPSSPSASSGGASVEAIAARVSPALVNITSTFGYQGAEGAGTGIVLTSGGEILTNNHVIEGADSIRATDVATGRTYRAKVVGYDRTKDIAVLRLDGASGLQTARLGDSSGAAVGQSIVAIGNAGGSGGAPVAAAGTITRLDRSITAGNDFDGSSERLTGLIQVNADVQPGDSGGSLVNSAAEVIGVDTAASAGFSLRSTGSQGFAIPINQALAVVKQIESGTSSGTVHVGPTALLGVLSSGAGSRDAGNSDGSTAPGAQISGVTEGGAAQHAGLSGGDVITSLNGQPIDSQSTLSKVVVGLKPGDSVVLAWIDGAGQSHTTTVNLGSGPPA